MALIRPYETDKFTSYNKEETIKLLSIAIWMKDDYTKKTPVGNVRVMIKDGHKNIESIKNPSGYHIFTDLENRDYEVSIEPEFYFPNEKKTNPSKLKNLSALNLSFNGDGPDIEALSAKLSNVLHLDMNYVLEFRNPEGKIEERSITKINPFPVNNDSPGTIFWDEPLKYGFNKSGSTVKAVNYLIEFVLIPRVYYPFPNNATLVRGLIKDSVSNKKIINAEVNVPGRGIQTRSDDNGEFVLHFAKINKEEVVTIEIKKDGSIKTIDTKVKEWKMQFMGNILFP
ncbi:MAG: hypothetical protein OIN86_10695 [Candidatus Methanoperedens sp.]|nr:hypothetical protein [Candidatus Methanoperedens sp.]CAG0963852.1 hypothetical protein METP1_00863 [Methanosarcinales archaeon]